MLNQDTKRKIDSARDILVGKVPDPKAQVEQITTALIYKFMDDMDKEAQELGGKSRFFTNGYEKYSWTKLMDAKLGGHDRLDLYSEAISKLSLNPHIPQLFRDIFKDAFLPYRSPETLSLFLKEINGFAYTHSEDLGDAFEYLLSVLGSQGDAGQFRTPRHIIDFIVEVINPRKDESICDPACGTAGFLISAYKHILKQHDGLNDPENKEKPLTPDERKNLMDHFTGYDISPDMVKLSRVNLYLHGFPSPTIHEYDTLSSEEKWDESFDVMLANPPFMTPRGGIKPHKRFSVQANRSEVLFVDYILEHLRPNGRAGIIVPEGIIFQSGNAYKQLRKMLVEDGLLAVVSLPAGVFNPYAGVKTCILLFDKALSRKAKDQLFIKIQNDGYGLGAQRRKIDENDLPEALKIIKKYKTALKNNKQFDFSGNEEKTAHLVAKEIIAESGDYNLSGDRYKEADQFVDQKWPLVELEKLAKVFTDGNWIESKDQSKSGIRLIQTGNIGLGEYLDKSGKTRFISEETFKKLNCTEIFANDILVSRLPDPVGRTCMLPKLDTRIITAVDCTIIRFDEKKIIHKYFLYFSKSKRYFNEIKRYLTGSSRQRISRSNLAKIEIPLPPLEIQGQIVAELDGYAGIIFGAKQIVQNWKPKIDIDPEWEKVKLGEVCELAQGFAVNAKSSHALKIDGDMPLLRIKDLIHNTWEQKVDSSLVPKSTIVVEDDLLYTRTGQIGLIFTGRSGVLHNNSFKISYDKSRLTKNYLYNFLMSEDVRSRIIDMSTRSAQPDVTHGVFKSIEIPIPSLAIQKQIVEKIEAERALVESAKKLIEIYEQKIQQVLGEI